MWEEQPLEERPGADSYWYSGSPPVGGYAPVMVKSLPVLGRTEDIDLLAQLCPRIAEMEASESERKWAEEELKRVLRSGEKPWGASSRPWH